MCLLYGTLQWHTDNILTLVTAHGMLHNDILAISW